MAKASGVLCDILIPTKLKAKFYRNTIVLPCSMEPSVAQLRSSISKNERSRYENAWIKEWFKN